MSLIFSSPAGDATVRSSFVEWGSASMAARNSLSSSEKFSVSRGWPPCSGQAGYSQSMSMPSKWYRCANAMALWMNFARPDAVLAISENRCLVDSKRLKFQPPMAIDTLRCGYWPFLAITSEYSCSSFHSYVLTL